MAVLRDFGIGNRWITDFSSPIILEHVLLEAVSVQQARVSQRTRFDFPAVKHHDCAEARALKTNSLRPVIVHSWEHLKARTHSCIHFAEALNPLLREITLTQAVQPHFNI